VNLCEIITFPEGKVGRGSTEASWPYSSHKWLMNLTSIGLQLTLSMIILRSNTKKRSSSSYAPHIKSYYFLRSRPQFAHVGVFNRDEKSVNVNTTPVTV